MNISSSRPGGTAISIRAGRDVREEVGTPSFIPASLFDGLALPILSAHHSIYHLKIGCRHPFRKSLQFIVISVMSVMSGTFPYTYRVFYMTVNRWCICEPSYHRHGERHGGKAYLSGLLA